MHATCTTLDIGSWWYLKSRPLCAIVKGYFFSGLWPGFCAAIAPDYRFCEV
jgi:hypothetical protein